MIPKIDNCPYDHVILNNDNPQLIHIKNFISQEECSNILNFLPELDSMPATTVEKGESVHTDNRKATTYFNWNGKWATEDLMNIDKRIMELTNWRSDRTENWAFIKYGIGDRYLPHYDYYDEENPTRRQRNGTFIVYLKSADEGGNTCFPHLKQNIKGEPGDAIFFNYIPRECPQSFHGGTTVTKGEKIIMTRWLNTISNDEQVQQLDTPVKNQLS